MACFHGKIVILPHHARSCASMNVSVYIRSDLQQRIIIKKKGGGVISFKKIKNRVNFSSSVSIADVTNEISFAPFITVKAKQYNNFPTGIYSFKIDIFDEKVNNFMTMTTMTVSLDFFEKREAERNEKQKEIVKISRVKRGKTIFLFFKYFRKKIALFLFFSRKKKKMFPRIN